jgi:hypothetical protein
MNIKSRVEKLEAARGGEDNVTIEELILEGIRCRDGGEPDPAFEERASRSILGKLIAAAVAGREARLETSGAVS